MMDDRKRPVPKSRDLKIVSLSYLSHFANEIGYGKYYEELKDILIRGLIDSDYLVQEKTVDDIVDFSWPGCRIKRAYVGDLQILVDAEVNGREMQTYWVCRVPMKFIERMRKGREVDFAHLEIDDYCMD
jgi:hypothetical protein